MNFERYWLKAAVLAVVVTAALMTFQSERRYVQGFAADDAFYYTVIARNFAADGLPTFDRYTLTNGFHPLYAFLLTGLVAISPFGKGWDFTLQRLLVFALNLGALFFYYRLLTEARLRPYAIGAFLITLFVFWRSVMIQFSGLEPPLVNMMIAASLLTILRLKNRPVVKRALWTGVVIGLAFLSRLDSIFILAPLALYAIAIVLKRRHREQLALVGGGLVIAVPYIIYNYLTFGNIVPGSGLRKMSAGGTTSSAWMDFWDRIIWQLHAIIPWRGVDVFILIGVLALTLIAVVIAFRRMLRRERQTADEMLAICCAGAIMHFAFVNFFMVEANVYWYHYQLYILVATAVAYLVNGRFEASEGTRTFWSRITPAAVTLYALALIALWGYRFRANVAVPTYNSDAQLLAEWVQRSTPPDARILMYDPGVFAYYSERNTICTNGLIGDAFIRKCVLGNDISAMYQRFHPDYIVVEQYMDYPEHNRFGIVIPPDKILHTSPGFPVPPIADRCFMLVDAKLLPEYGLKAYMGVKSVRSGVNQTAG